MFAPRFRPPAPGPEIRTDLPSAAARSGPTPCSGASALPCACARCSQTEGEAGPARSGSLPDLTRIPAVARERSGWTAGGLAAVQTKLPVARPDDPLEAEADRVADRIMAGGGAAGTLAPAAGAPGAAVQAKPAGTSPVAAAVPGLGSGGRPLAEGDRQWFEPRFGTDFGDVRIHDDASASSAAEAIGALAYTSGSHIAFARDRYAPGTEAGRRLLAHELTHVVQQRGGARPQPAPGAVSSAIPVSAGKADGTIYRQVSPCHPTTRWPGNMEHALIEDDYVTNINRVSGALEYAIPGSGPNGGVGYADMVDTATHKIYEIKTYLGAAAGVAQAQNYANMANANCPAPIPQSPWTVGNDYPAHTILISATEAITVQQYPQFPGVVVYHRRKRPQRVPVPVRRRAPRTVPQNAPQPAPQQAPQPLPQPIPVPVMQQIEEFIHEVVETGVNAEQAANRFLRDHPELVYVVAGLSIGIFLATIAEDILTLGAGIADDPATMGAAWALWQAARAMQAAR